MTVKYTETVGVPLFTTVVLGVPASAPAALSEGAGASVVVVSWIGRRIRFEGSGGGRVDSWAKVWVMMIWVGLVGDGAGGRGVVSTGGGGGTVVGSGSG